METPEYQHHEEFKNSSARLAEIRALGIDLYLSRIIPINAIERILL